MGYTFDPDAAGATLAFTDGVTTVPANFLDALVIRFGSGRDAYEALPEGSTGEVVDTNPATKLIEPLVETAVASGYNTTNWDINSTHWFGVKGATGLVVETRSIEAFAVVSPVREFTVSWAAGTIEFVRATDKYLCVGGTDSGAAADKIDIWDLDTDTLVGTYTATNDFTVANRGGAVIGTENLFVGVDNGSIYTIEAVALASAAIDTSWATSGIFTLATGIGYMAIDDERLWHISVDDLTVINVESGASIASVTGVGTGTSGAGIAADGTGAVYLLQQGGGTFISKHRIDDEATPVVTQLWEVDLGFTPQNWLGTDGRWLYVTRSAASPLVMFDTRTGAKKIAGPDAYTGINIPVLFDGLHAVAPVTTAAGAGVDGMARIKGASTARRVQRLDQGSYGRGPWENGLAPVDL